MSVTKAIGRPFEPEPEQEGNSMDEHEDSPFQNVKQENPFQVPMNSIAQQASYAASQMAQMRPEAAGPMGAMQEESAFQPQREESENQGEFLLDIVKCGTFHVVPCHYLRSDALVIRLALQ